MALYNCPRGPSSSIVFKLELLPYYTANSAARVRSERKPSPRSKLSWISSNPMNWMHLRAKLTQNTSNHLHLTTKSYKNHSLFLQHAQTYLLLMYAIKWGDIGLIRRATWGSVSDSPENYQLNSIVTFALPSSSRSSPPITNVIFLVDLGSARPWPHPFWTDYTNKMCHNSSKNGVRKRTFTDSGFVFHLPKHQWLEWYGIVLYGGNGRDCTNGQESQTSDRQRKPW